MKKSWLHYLLLCCIALQSFVVVANNQDVHITDPQHLSTVPDHQKHKHAQASILDASDVQEGTIHNIDLQEHDEEDCHHCGHCHGSHMQWVYISETVTDDVFHHPSQFHYAELTRNHFVDNDLRPPVA